MTVIEQTALTRHGYSKRIYPSTTLYILTADIATPSGVITRPLQSYEGFSDLVVYATDNPLAADVWDWPGGAGIVQDELNDPETGLVGRKIRNIRKDEILGTVEHVKVGIMKAEYEVMK